MTPSTKTSSTKTSAKAATKASAAAGKKAASPSPTTTPATPAAPALNTKQTRTRISKIQQDRRRLRKVLWPAIEDSALWLRENHDRKGFTTVPRTLPLLMELINDLSKGASETGQATPAGRSYLALWCRVFDEGFVSIDNEKVAAREAGYTGERSATTWRQHLNVLKTLGFIDFAPGRSGPYEHILLFNPYRTVLALKAAGKVQAETFTVLYQRAMEIGATDLEEFAALYPG